MLTELQRETVIALVNSAMRIETAARDIPCHRNTMHYHIDKIHEQTGLDPMNFFDLHKLYAMAKGEDG